MNSSPAGDDAAHRLRALDGLRLLCALMVCLYHYAGRDGPVAKAWGEAPHELFPLLVRGAKYGSLAVQAFFVISGFVICMSSWGRTPAEFFRSRVSRLFPAYWVAVVACAIAIKLVPIVKPPHLHQVLVNLGLLQYALDSERVLGVCWTLWVEARFYILFTLVVWKGLTYRRVLLFCGFWAVGAALAASSHNELLTEVFMPKQASFFIGGLALYLIHRFGGNALLWGIVIVAWTVGQHYAVDSLWNPKANVALLRRSPFVIMGIVTFGYVVVAAVATGRLSWARWRWLSIAGALTYPFYLLHEHMGWVMIKLLRERGLAPDAILLTTVGTFLVLAYLVYRFVETPLAPRLKRALAIEPPATAVTRSVSNPEPRHTKHEQPAAIGVTERVV